LTRPHTSSPFGGPVVGADENFSQSSLFVESSQNITAIVAKT
jgi:hypothetical protein